MWSIVAARLTVRCVLRLNIEMVEVFRVGETSAAAVVLPLIQGI